MIVGETEVVRTGEVYAVRRRVIVEIVRVDGEHIGFAVPDDDEANALAVAFGDEEDDAEL